uniref:Secreted protein n=1 Tax=Cyanothece sp. (strain PCC 7425 / ATCC 29141) TaxID=395961 RepID=B8HYC5_CYAP4
MKFLNVLIPAVTLTVAAVTPALASPKVEIMGANYGGSGCPNQSASVSVSPDGQELSILFDQFVAVGNDLKESRKSCNLSIPIQLPEGFQISLYDADYRGYVSPSTTGNLRAEYFFAGQRGPVFSRSFRGETNYNVRDSLATVANVWSACGDSVNMRVNASMTARGAGMATLDSFDLAHRGLVYHIKYRPCGPSAQR